MEEFFTQKLGSRGGLTALTDVEGLIGGVGYHDHGKEYTVLTVDGNHAVGGGGFVENAVALPEDFLVIADADAHGTLDHQVKFLTGMGGGVDGLILQLLIIFIGDPVGGGELFAEHGGHVLNGDAVFAGSGQALTFPGNGIAGESCAVAFQQNRQLHTKDLGALVQEGEGKIHRTGFVKMVVFFGNIGKRSHFLHAVAQNLTHIPDSHGDIHQLCCRIGHKYPSFQTNKKSPQELLLETSNIIPAVPLKLRLLPSLQVPVNPIP